MKKMCEYLRGAHILLRSVLIEEPVAIFTTLHFLCNLPMGTNLLEYLSTTPLAFPAKCNAKLGPFARKKKKKMKCCEYGT
jgi:hypothetical protein